MYPVAQADLSTKYNAEPLIDESFIVMATLQCYSHGLVIPMPSLKHSVCSACPTGFFGWVDEQVSCFFSDLASFDVQ